jgi:hypothetical protein
VAATFLLATSNSLDSDIAAASYLAAQLKSDDAKKAAVALGISPDLIPALSPACASRDQKVSASRASPGIAIPESERRKTMAIWTLFRNRASETDKTLTRRYVSLETFHCIGQIRGSEERSFDPSDGT